MRTSTGRRINVKLHGTWGGKMRAKVQILDPPERRPPAFEVTIGTAKWDDLDKDIREAILKRAFDFVERLRNQLCSAEAALNPIPFG